MMSESERSREPEHVRCLLNSIVPGAFYEITSGAVDFLETEEELRVNK